jgi:uncharacterized cupredoxin-like copper-binding protein
MLLMSSASNPRPGARLGRGRVAVLLVAAVTLSGATTLLLSDRTADPAVTSTAATGAPTDPANTVPTPPATSATTSTQADRSDHAAVVAGSTTQVAMGEFFYDMPTTFEAGSHTFEVVNDGQTPHEFALGALGDHHAHFGQTDWLDRGDTQSVTVELEAGTYEVACHVPGHYEAGMTTTITVTG